MIGQKKYLETFGSKQKTPELQKSGPTLIRPKNKKINGIKVFFRQVDCDEEGEIAEEYKVENYPTLKLIKGDEIIEFNAKPEADILEEFLQTVL